MLRVFLCIAILLNESTQGHLVNKGCIHAVNSCPKYVACRSCTVGVYSRNPYFLLAHACWFSLLFFFLPRPCFLSPILNLWDWGCPTSTAQLLVALQRGGVVPRRFAVERVVVGLCYVCVLFCALRILRTRVSAAQYSELAAKHAVL